MSNVLRTGEVTKSEVKKEKACQTRGAQGNSTTTGVLSLCPEPDSGREKGPVGKQVNAK